MTHLTRLAIALCALVLAVGCQSTDNNPTPDQLKAALARDIEEAPAIPPPATITITKASPGEPPNRNFHVDVTLKNRREKAVWFVLPYYGDEPLPKDEMFRSESAKKIPFESYKYDGTTAGGKGQSVVVSFIGTKRFIAVRVNAKATVRLRDLTIASKRPFKKLQVWEARIIRVNSNTALERWLPYRTMTDNDADIPAKSSSFRLDMKEKGTKIREDFPKGGVDHIWITSYDKWEIDVKSK